MIGQGMEPQQALKKVGAVVEGYYAAATGKELANRLGVEMPITEALMQCCTRENRYRCLL